MSDKDPLAEYYRSKYPPDPEEVGKQKGFDEAVKLFILIGAFILFSILLYHFFGPGWSGDNF
jgi:hypothetical protein